jgi:hypothetical protein
VAVQWGLFGCVVLYAMWLCHLLLFRGKNLSSWIGLLVVAQNVVSSLLNSHLFDFHKGWIYVLGVGVAGGDGAEGEIGQRSGSHAGKVCQAVTAGACDRDKLTTAGIYQNPMFRGEWLLNDAVIKSDVS